MYNSGEEKYVVIEFAVIRQLWDTAKKSTILLSNDEIIEIAAVKIEHGKIKGHFHSFVSKDGIDANQIDFDDIPSKSFYASAQHLIGAPSFNEVAEKIHKYTEDCTLIVRNPFAISNSPFATFKNKAASVGIFFNNPIINISHIATATQLKNSAAKKEINLNSADVLQIAQLLASDKCLWSDIFAEYEIYFVPDGDGNEYTGRNDPLSWALAFARLFIAIATKECLLECDDELPF